MYLFKTKVKKKIKPVNQKNCYFAKYRLLKKKKKMYIILFNFSIPLSLYLKHVFTDVKETDRRYQLRSRER